MNCQGYQIISLMICFRAEVLTIEMLYLVKVVAIAAAGVLKGVLKDLQGSLEHVNVLVKLNILGLIKFV
jgi:RNA-binding protein YhbY